MMEQIAQLRYAKITPRKARLVADAVKGLPVNEAEAQLIFSQKRGAAILLKVLRSAVAGATNNQKLAAEHLFVKNVLVNQGPMLKRFLPRARGSASPIQKKMSHIKVVLGYDESLAKPRFAIPVKEKRKPKKEEKKRAPKSDHKGEEKPKREVQSQMPFYRRIFRRKAV